MKEGRLKEPEEMTLVGLVTTIHLALGLVQVRESSVSLEEDSIRLTIEENSRALLVVSENMKRILNLSERSILEDIDLHNVDLNAGNKVYLDSNDIQPQRG
jgi:hypothetical protein